MSVLASRALRGWSRLALEVALLLAVLVLLQVAAERTNRRIDMTAERSLSLKPLTRQVLGEVQGPLTITVFYRRGAREQHAGLLRRLVAENPKVTFALYDIDRYPERARALGVAAAGRAAIEYAGRRHVAPALPEEELAGGILGVVRGRERRVVLVTGHGERAPGGGDDSLGRLVAALDAENYRVDVGSLLDEAMPRDADVLVVAGPRRDLVVRELEAVADFLRRGGGVVLLLDPGPLPNLRGFLGGLGIALGDDLIVDRERRVLGTEGLAAIVEQFRQGNPISHPASNPIESGVVLPSARTVDVTGAIPGVVAESIARTGETAWAMRDLDRARRGEEPTRAADDVPGPVSVMAMAEVAGSNGTDHRGRLVVVGDADFASDAYLDVLGNRDVALNAVAWAAVEDVLAGTRPTQVPEIQRPLSPMLVTDAEARALLAGVTVIEPGLVLALGVVVAALRRRRG